MKTHPIGKSMWNLTGEYFCLLKEKDLYEPYQMENIIIAAFFVLVFFDISTNSFIVYSATTLSKRARRQ